MASTGFTLAGTGTNNADAGNVAWSNPGNVTASDNTRAISGLDKSQTTQYLHATNFGFSIPSGATIDGIEVRVERHTTVTGLAADHTVQLIKGGTRSGNNKASADSWPNGTDANKDYGGAADLWGNTLTDSDVNASTFGVAFRAQEPTGVSSPSIRVDAIWINVHYTEGGGALDIVPDTVAWSWTSTAVSLERGREIVPDSVAWAWSVTDATFRKGKKIVPESVAWSFSAANVSLERGREIVPDSLSWSYTAANVSLEKGFEVVPESLTWTWAATDVSLEHGKEIVPESVAWAWSAADVTLTYISTKTIVPESVAWMWSAQDVSLEHGKEIVPDSVDWTWSPGDVALTHSAVAPVDVIRPGGGLPLSEAEYRRLKRKEEREEYDPPPQIRVVEKIGVAQPEVTVKPFTPSEPIKIPKLNLVKRRNRDDEWFLMN